MKPLTRGRNYVTDDPNAFHRQWGINFNPPVVLYMRSWGDYIEIVRVV